jgi:L,D-transpeptidase catalytic domain
MRTETAAGLLMRLAVMVLVMGCVLFASSARAAVVVVVNKSQQRMSVMVDGQTRYDWAVSTGRAGYGTPNGVYHPQHLARTWFSRKYYNSPMPHSIFFHGGFAIHGSYEISRLGGPASHGCIRLHPSNAARLFALVEGQGAGNTRIIVTGANPGGSYASPGRGYRGYEMVPRYNGFPGFDRGGMWFYGRS